MCAVGVAQVSTERGWYNVPTSNNEVVLFQVTPSMATCTAAAFHRILFNLPDPAFLQKNTLLTHLVFLHCGSGVSRKNFLKRLLAPVSMMAFAAMTRLSSASWNSEPSASLCSALNVLSDRMEMQLLC